MFRRLRDWLFTVPFFLAFGLALLVFDVAGRIVRPFSMRGFEWVMAALQRTLIGVFRICGTTVEVDRSPLIERGRGYAIVSNHQSMFDIVLIGGLLFSNYPKYVAKRELGRWIPSISLNLRWGGNALIDRGDRAQAVQAITEMAATAQQRDVSVVIFPEGTRSRDGSVREFRRSGMEAMLEAADRLPVIPTTVDGAWQLLRYNLRPVPFGTHVRVRFGDPIERSPDDASAVAAGAEAEIRSTVASWRKVDPPGQSGRRNPG
ncbi:MAG TPA: lysophospholipid acyltransferase family protein [Acidimicrobiia bacterium]|jgi:1-acyl-sn-glycerol-3-phosphate acyltransferase|nr:lysophospholipid acyltransferase family protein [Acidimicrobiia bacterium]